MVRMNSPGWGEDSDRIEILWGPDYKDRHDFMAFKDGKYQLFYSKLPDSDDDPVMIDKREEIELFDRNEGFRSIGITVGPSERRQESESGHVMF